jgi:hypothetical protein
MAAARGAADVAASSPQLYNRFRAGLADLMTNLRTVAPGTAAGAARPAARRGRRGAAEDDGVGSGAGGSGPPAGSGLPALRGDGRALACRVQQKRRRAPLFPLSELSDSDEDGDACEDSGVNETVCHLCSRAGELVCCDECPHAFHARCLPGDAMAVESDPWLCPVCAGSDEPAGFVGRPQQPAQRGSLQRSRKRAKAEGTRLQVAAAKKKRRGKKQYR